MPGCGVTGELALPLACHLPRPSMESRGGGGGGTVGVPFAFNCSEPRSDIMTFASCVLGILTRTTQ